MSKAPQATGQTRRTCPSCSRRSNQSVDPACPICRGMGVLLLGGPALRRYPGEVVSRAVEYALEAQAQHDLSARNVSVDKARQNLTAMVGRLIKAGLLAAWATPPAASPTHPDQSRIAIHKHARALSEQASGLPYDEGTGSLLAAPPVHYEPGSVTVDGTLPGFSRAGFLCALSRVTDPIDVLTVHVVGTPDQASIDRRGDILGKAMTPG